MSEKKSISTTFWKALWACVLALLRLAAVALSYGCKGTAVVLNFSSDLLFKLSGYGKKH